MKRKRFRRKFLFLVLVIALVWGASEEGILKLPFLTQKTTSENSVISGAIETIQTLVGDEPAEVSALKARVYSEGSESHPEYYYSLLSEEQQRAYREMLEGIQNRKSEFYLTIPGGDAVDQTYHALLNDHPELYWVHNREKVYTTTYSNKDYCLFNPGYGYTEEEITQIDAAIETAYQAVAAQITDESDTYEKIRLCYDYLVDHTEYVSSDDDQNIAGAFWKGQAVCAGYARGMQYLLDRLGIYCIYVEGDTRGSDQGHAWNIVDIDGQYYIVDATNADQPQFLEGDAVQLAEHKTILYDYLCPFPEEYAQMYTESSEFALPEVTATDKNFYVLNQACFDSYDYNTIYNFCLMRLDNGAAVIRFKFSSQEAFDSACADWVNGNSAEGVAQYYMSKYGLSTVQYHYGILDDLKTIYFIF